jgi:hypothetical protein
VSWKGNDLDYAKAVANGSFHQVYLDYIARHETYTRTVNMNHFGPHVPAAAYYEQSNCFFWDTDPEKFDDKKRCETITEGRYFPDLVLPEKMRSLDTAWKDCEMAAGVQDPPIILSKTDRINVPTISAAFENQIPPSEAHLGGRLVPEITPAPTARPYRVEGASGSSVSQWITVGTATMQAVFKYSFPDGVLNGQRIEGISLPNLSNQHEDPNSKSVVPVHIVVGSKTIAMTGPAQTVAGEVVSLRRDGLVIGEADGSNGRGVKTIAFPQLRVESAPSEGTTSNKDPTDSSSRTQGNVIDANKWSSLSGTTGDKPFGSAGQNPAASGNSYRVNRVTIGLVITFHLFICLRRFTGFG